MISSLAYLIGDPGEARTLDPMIKSHLLYQLSYGVSLRRRGFRFSDAKVMLFSGTAREFLKILELF